MKLIIAGGRDFDNYDRMKKVLGGLLMHTDKPITIISGTAKGADRLGERWAHEFNVGIVSMPAQWGK